MDSNIILMNNDQYYTMCNECHETTNASTELLITLETIKLYSIVL